MGKVKVKEVYEKDPTPGSRIQEPLLINFQHAQGNSRSTKMDLNSVFRNAVYQTTPKSPMKDFSHLNRSGFENRVKVKEEDGSSVSQRTRGCKRQFVALQSNTMTYIGNSNEDQEMLRTYVALREGKRLRVYEVTPITVSPFIKGHSHVVENERDTKIKRTPAEKREANKDLLKAFGSKRKRLNFEKLEKNKIDIVDMNESMSKAFNQTKAPDEEPQIRDESVLGLIPPCNRQANSAAEVYNIEDILHFEDSSNMDEIADQFLNLETDEIKQWHSTKKYSDYFFAMWNKLHMHKSDPKSIEKAKLVLYTELLICLLKLRHDQIRKKVLELPEVFPSWLKEKALDAFTTVNAKGIRNRPETSKDKTCCYIMVLVLLANDFIMDIQLMSTSLQVHIKKLLTLARVVGVTLTQNKSTKEQIGILKLPLPKPVETRGRRRALR